MAVCGYCNFIRYNASVVRNRPAEQADGLLSTQRSHLRAAEWDPKADERFTASIAVMRRYCLLVALWPPRNRVQALPEGVKKPLGPRRPCASPGAEQGDDRSRWQSMAVEEAK